MRTKELDTANSMIREGQPFDEIEEFIDNLALSIAQQSALWLLAWADATSDDRQRMVTEILEADAPSSAIRPGASGPSATDYGF